MKKTVKFLKQQSGEVVRITAEYNGINAVYRSVGNVSECRIEGRGNARQMKFLLKEFINSTRAAGQ